MTPLATELAGIRLENPLVLSSGILGLSASSLKRAADSGAGAVTSKSCGPSERPGHKCPSILPFSHGLLNAVGLANPGVSEMVKELVDFRKTCSRPLIASIFGATVGEFGDVAAVVAQAEPDMIEVNVSCPNVAAEFGRPFAADPKECGRIVRLVKERAGKIPVAMKLSAAAPSIAAVAKACEDNGADAITAINSVGPGMVIDVGVRRPVLSNKVGGVSGPGILPVAVRCVYEIFRAVRIPIIGGGGVIDSNGALQMILAGATAVGIGTGILERGLEIFGEIGRGIEAHLAENRIESVRKLIGAAHG